MEIQVYLHASDFTGVPGKFGIAGLAGGREDGGGLESGVRSHHGGLSTAGNGGARGREHRGSHFYLYKVSYF